MQTNTPEPSAPPAVWAVTLGYNHAEDTLACLRSLQQSRYAPLHLLFVDNNSADDSLARVLAEIPAAAAIRLPANIGFARGFNAALAYAMRQGADFIFMLNNDTVVDAETVGNLAAAAQAEPRAGIVVPKIYYFDQPEVVWSAGSRFRRFPPAVVLRRTAGADDGRYDRELNLEFTTTCALLLRRSLIEDVGLLDPNFFILYDDYDLSLRAREQGYLIRFAPDAHLRHKVSKSTAVGAPNPFYWFHYGRSAMIFCRKHQRRRLMTGPWHRWYVILRFLAEGKHFGLRPFLKGLRAGRTATLLPVPRWDDATVDRGAIVRESPQTDK